jgi:outer membrane protein assembly factor BamE (lipoprotein component of BamABCDE complex)
MLLCSILRLIQYPVIKDDSKLLHFSGSWQAICTHYFHNLGHHYRRGADPSYSEKKACVHPNLQTRLNGFENRGTADLAILGPKNWRNSGGWPATRCQNPQGRRRLDVDCIYKKRSKRRRKMKFVSVTLGLLLIFMAGCATTQEGRKIDSAKVDQLGVGTVRAERVTDLFGTPDQVEKLPSGAEKYMYEYGYKQDISHWWTIDSINGQRLEVQVKDGVVQTYKFREDGKEAYLKEAYLSPADLKERGWPLFRDDKGGMNAGKRSELLKAQTTEEQVVGILGKPAKIERPPAGGPNYIYQYYFEQYTHWYTPPSYDRQTLVVMFKDGLVDNYIYTGELRGNITKQDK